MRCGTVNRKIVSVRHKAAAGRITAAARAKVGIGIDLPENQGAEVVIKTEAVPGAAEALHTTLSLTTTAQTLSNLDSWVS